jgi:hypothetical protein
MRAAGLENVRLEPWEIPVGWERGTATARLVSPDTGRTLHVAAMGWTPGTNGPVTGPVVVMQAKTKDDLAKYKGKLKNAIVMRGPATEIAPITDLTYLSPKPKTDGKTGPKPPAKEPPPQRVTTADVRAFQAQVGDFLKSEGAACILVDSLKPHGLLVTTGRWPDGDRGTPQNPMPVLYTAHEHYALLYRLATRPGSEPPQVEVNVSNRFVPGPITVYNTVGEVRGAGKPDEFVVVGAHLDSWDLGTGTTDNGTGSCVVLEVGRAVAALAKAGAPPERTIRFVLFSGEEQGLHGSKQYVKKHEAEMPRTSAAMVHDTGTGRVHGLGMQNREKVRDLLAGQLGSLRELEGWRGLDLAGSGGTDHLSFEAVGVPGFACRQESDEYRLTHHTQSDTFDKAKGPNLIQGAQVLAVAAVRIANLPDLLPREKPPEPKK